MKTFVFRVAILLVIVGVLLAWVGWLRFDNTADRTTIELNTGEIQRAADKAVGEGREFLDETRESIHKETAEPEPAASPY